MRIGRVLLGLGLVAQIGVAEAATPPGLGFDPAKFHLPVYPKATLRPGSAAAFKSAYGMRRLAVLTTTDPEDTVVKWYAAHWKDARTNVLPAMHEFHFGTGWGVTSVQAVITNADGQTDIRLMVPGS